MIIPRYYVSREPHEGCYQYVQGFKGLLARLLVHIAYNIYVLALKIDFVCYRTILGTDAMTMSIRVVNKI